MDWLVAPLLPVTSELFVKSRWLLTIKRRGQGDCLRTEFPLARRDDLMQLFDAFGGCERDLSAQAGLRKQNQIVIVPQILSQSFQRLLGSGDGSGLNFFEQPDLIIQVFHSLPAVVEALTGWFSFHR